MPRSTKIYGLDTSVFVLLLTGHPESDFKKTVAALKKRYDADPATELVVSNQVIGEAYITLQHFYEISKPDACAAILHVFNNGSIAPVNGQPVINILNQNVGAGLMDRLIAQDYIHQNIKALTNDKRMAKLDGVELLK
jgi:predicted nucleic acid-binding protein